MERLGIFGGTFAPPHNGHMAAALAFAKELGLAKVLLMPTCIPPHKQASSADDPQTRLHLLQLACQSVAPSPLTVSDYEIARGEVSYTYQTLKAFAAPNRKLYFLCGTDMFLTLPIWKEAQTIFDTATIVCMRRENDPELARQLSAATADYKTRFGADILFLHQPPIDISSSQVRQMLAENDVRAKEVLPPEVYDYIVANGLYRKEEPLTAFVKAHIDGYRYTHTCSVAKECERLANIFGLSFQDRNRLHTAAMLHDVTKQLSTEEQIALLARFGESATTEDLASPKTLHARTAALLVAAECAELVDAGICHAIAVHTTGGTDMSLFDWLLYLADYIEPLRTFPDCVTLRKFFYDGINAGKDKVRHLYDTIVYSFEMTVAQLEAEHAPIHPTTLAVLETLRAHSEDFPCARPKDCF